MEQVTSKMLHVVCKVLIAVTLAISSVEADCVSPPNIPNAVSNITGSQSYPENSTVRYDCKLGYNPAGTSRFFTCRNAVWIGGNFRCEEIFCSYVKPPENGRIMNQPTNEVGSSIKFTCKEGHDMYGADMMICQTDGKWSPSVPPTCIAKDCGEFGSIQYAETFQDSSETERNHYGSVVEITCQTGRVLIGPPHVKCEANGQWGARPTCEMLKCPPYPNTKSSCLAETLLSGSLFFVVCKEDMATRTGPDAAECVSGEWDSLEMACLCDCIIPDYDTSLITINNLNSFGNLPHVTELDWNCNGGSSRSEIDTVICIDGTLNALQNGKEVVILNNSNHLNINRAITSHICIAPKTDAPTTTSSIPTTVPINSSQIGTSSRDASATTVSISTPMTVTFYSASLRKGSSSGVPGESNTVPINQEITTSKALWTTTTAVATSVPTTSSGIDSSSNVSTASYTAQVTEKQVIKIPSGSSDMYITAQTKTEISSGTLCLNNHLLFFILVIFLLFKRFCQW